MLNYYGKHLIRQTNGRKGSNTNFPKRLSRGSWTKKHPWRLRAAVYAAIDRCNNVRNQAYRNYGARGITVYKEWLNDPRLFVEYLVNLPDCRTKGYVLDRIDNDKGYEPGNLRFVNQKKSLLNRRCGQPKGEIAHHAYLTEAEVKEAKELRKLDPKRWTFIVLGRKYNVTPTGIMYAIKGVNWKHLQ